MKVHDTRSHAHMSSDDKVMARKHKAEGKLPESDHSPKKAKPENGNGAGDSAAVSEFKEFCEAVKANLSVEQMKQVLESNGQDSSGTHDEVISRCQDLLFYGALEKCPVCGNDVYCDNKRYFCKSDISEWCSCVFSTKSPPRKEDSIKIPDSVLNSAVSDMIKKRQDPSRRPKRELRAADKPFSGKMVSLMGRLTRTHQYWKKKIERHGGKVTNSIQGVTCLVVSPAERERGGSPKLVEAMERNIPVVSEAWLIDSIEKQEVQPLEAYDVVSDLSVAGKGIPWDKQDSSQEALELLSGELKMYGKRAVYKDTRLRERGGKILEKDGLLYNCAFSICDLGKGRNEYCIMQLITVPESNLNLYFKRGKVGDDPNAEERLEEWEDTEAAIREFSRLFEEVTGNEFEPWEREKKIQKKPHKFFPIDMDDGVEVRHGALGLRQLGVAAAHCKLDSFVANFMKVICSQEIYKYALMELGLDPPDLPIGMVTDLHLKRCEEVLLEFIEKFKTTTETGQKATALWADFSSRWFSLLHVTRPMILHDFHELAEHGAAVFETVRDINVASRVIGDMGADTLDDPLSDRYNKLGCKISVVDKESEDYKMIVKYLETTYEPVRVADVEYGVSVENIFSVESDAMPSLDEIKKLPNKVLLWCGSRSSNLLRHVYKGFLPAVCSLPVPGYMFGKAIVCSDAAAEAARYGFTAVDRPEGFLILAVASLGEKITELTSPPEDTKSLEEKKMGVKGLGRKKTEESTHFVWGDDIKVPCGRLVPSEHKDSPLEFNEYAVYDPKQTSIRFLVGVKYEEKRAEYVDVEPQ
ncbi:PREDICTED: poly [ADP-ribose] polymerase 3 isoform X2 [Tarenaya hassleriana]|uniref:poly [ADP-ribose] polymerase 3 isoform X2 n=1 Tax=Tarenaya hassleriana TaxID=28532 RepID=UPI00053C408C|nr:PREDICTED: poly [ADP-ribose] polymerase 3 isoform X2 [Tarenaya hassleriana]